MTFRTFSVVLHLPMNSALSSPQKKTPKNHGGKKEKEKKKHKTHAGLLLAYMITKHCEDDKRLRRSLMAQQNNISNRSDKSSVKSFLQCDGGNILIRKH